MSVNEFCSHLSIEAKVGHPGGHHRHHQRLLLQTASLILAIVQSLCSEPPADWGRLSRGLIRVLCACWCLFRPEYGPDWSGSRAVVTDDPKCIRLSQCCFVLPVEKAETRPLTRTRPHLAFGSSCRPRAAHHDGSSDQTYDIS